MTDEGPSCSVWLLPTPDSSTYLQERIRALSVRFSAPMFAPHLTLIGNVPLSGDAVAASLAQFPPCRRLALPVEAAGHSARRFESLFIRLRPVPDLLRLRTEVASAVGVDLPTEYRPHVSVLYPETGLDERTRRALCSELIGSVPTLLEFGRLCAVEPVGPNRWEDVSLWRVL